MKINQLFVQTVGIDVVDRLVRCMDLDGIDDGKNFTKYDLVRVGSVVRVQNELLPELRDYYLPCKARLYLTDLTEKKVITITKQMLRLHGYSVLAKEKNFGSKKVIVYRIANVNTVNKIGMHRAHALVNVDFT